MFANNLIIFEEQLKDRKIRSLEIRNQIKTLFNKVNMKNTQMHGFLTKT